MFGLAQTLLSTILKKVKLPCKMDKHILMCFQSVHMAHALKRISYATCDPDNSQFSFLAREPRGQSNIQYCHAFITKSSEEVSHYNLQDNFFYDMYCMAIFFWGGGKDAEK